MPKHATFRVLCAIARAERAQAPTIGEWAEAIKCRLARQGFAYPLPHDVTAAMRATAHALARGVRHDR